MIITGKIDVTKITKSRLFKGEKGTYLNFALIPTPNSEHSDYMIVEDISQEEREDGKKGVVLGNGKERGGQRREQQQQSRPSRPNKDNVHRDDDPEPEDLIPF